MMTPTSFSWFARHEIGLSWRDWSAMMTAGKSVRRAVLFSIFGVAAIIFHLIAYALLSPWIKSGIAVNVENLTWLSLGGLTFFTVMLSQAMESVTRAYYARADLDLILSSPASPRRLFAVRTSAIVLTTGSLAFFIAGPAINVLAVMDGPQWLAAYLVLGALSALATALAIGFTAGLFRLFGARRTRIISQIAAAIVGAGFIIGLQVAGILAYGSLSRFSVLQSDWLVGLTPAIDNLLWLPARAAMGQPIALLLTIAAGIGAMVVAIAVTSSSFARHAIAAAGVSFAPQASGRENSSFHITSQRQTLRGKEWKLLLRDPWLLSQSLMQILYLVPPALMLWINFGQGSTIYIVIVPVLVMASGQLAGGLAWLAISGEDAHDLVTSAPVRPRDILIAKIQSVLAAITIIIAPLLAVIALGSIKAASITALGCALSAGSATAIQLWFRAQASRAMFRRRQISSRVATLSEAFASIMWAGTAALLLTMPLLAIAPAIVAVGVLGLARALRPAEINS